MRNTIIINEQGLFDGQEIYLPSLSSLEVSPSLPEPSGGKLFSTRRQAIAAFLLLRITHKSGEENETFTLSHRLNCNLYSKLL